MSFRLIQADVIAGLSSLPSNSVQCVVTSPPYWGLRDYGFTGQIGLEPTPGEYLARMVDVFRHVRRVMHSSATLWLNMGDSYTDGGRGTDAGSTLHGTRRNQSESRKVSVRERAVCTALAPKNLMMMPAQLALALQADGWYLRQQIPWVKANGMPESAADRPVSMVEYIYLLSKSEEYFYDREAVRIASSANTHDRGHGSNPKAVGPNSRINRDRDAVHVTAAHARAKQNRSFSDAVFAMLPTRARRNTDWFNDSFKGLLVDGNCDPLAMLVNPQPFSIEMCMSCEGIYPQSAFRKLVKVCADCGVEAAPEAKKCSCSSTAFRRRCACGKIDWVSHFATFPTKMVAPCILAGTSEYGCCSRCGAPWERVVSVSYAETGHKSTNARRTQDVQHIVGGSFRCADRLARQASTLSWRPTCDHPLFPGEVAPCTVLDPFAGSARTGLAALDLGRQFIGTEGNRFYAAMAQWQADQLLSQPATKGAVA